MVIKKEILNDLKKYNKDLEKYLPGVDFSYLEKVDLDSEKTPNEEYFGLLASNLVDLRTEFALMRKNLAVEIEGMVQRTITEQQNIFLDQANKFYGTIINDLKQNFSTYIKEINTELVKLKKEFNNFNIQNKDFSVKLDNFNNEILDLKKSIVKLDINISNNENALTPINFELDSIKNNLFELDSNLKELVSVNKDLKSNLNNNFQENILKVLNRILANEKEISQKVSSIKIEDNSKNKLSNLNAEQNNSNINFQKNILKVLNVILENEKEISNKIASINIDSIKETSQKELESLKDRVLEEKEFTMDAFKELDEKLEEKFEELMKRSNKKRVEKQVIVVEDSNKNKIKLNRVKPKKKIESSNVSRIIDIDSKLSKLNSLR